MEIGRRRFRGTQPRSPRILFLKGLILILALLSLIRCSHLRLRDCGGKADRNGKLVVLGVREARLRSSHWRMLLADVPAAAARFELYAAMSTLAYAKDGDCGNQKEKVSKVERERLEHRLREQEADGSRWTEVPELEFAGPCEDKTGLFYRVWKQERAGSIDVVLAFRGTWGAQDWFEGNLHWLTRILPGDDQYKLSRQYAKKVIDHFQAIAKGRPGLGVHFFTTGHSLGGGLAQHVLYSFPTMVEQAVVFDPSPVTGYREQTRQNQVLSCACDQPFLADEPRIYRVYDSREILSNARFFHKLFFGPERHIQEVRFEYRKTHSMKDLTFYLMEQAHRKAPADYSKPWFSAKGVVADTGESCTSALIRTQRESCARRVSASDLNRCPQ